jgi:hypothetical protein
MLASDDAVEVKEKESAREGWAALVLERYLQRRAGVARIRQACLPA